MDPCHHGHLHGCVICSYQSKQQCRYCLTYFLSSGAVSGGVCCPNRRGEWWFRLSLDTEHLGRTEESLEVCHHLISVCDSR